MKQSHYIFTTVSCITVASLFSLNIILSPLATGDISPTRRFVVSAQGKNRCPDLGLTQTRRVLASRSRLDCARNCATWSECLYYSFDGNNGSCTLYSTTPASMYPTDGCSFMLDPSTFEGCFSAASMRMDSGACNLPFQYSNTEFYTCIETNTTSKCGAANAQLADCIAPAGYFVQQDIVNWTAPVSEPLPCISNWIILMQQFNGSVNFNRNWVEYKHGFGDIRLTDFWIGNENMHLITNALGITYRLRVEVQTELTGFWYYAEYETFSIDSEVNQYKLHLANYSGNAGDSLSNTTIGGKYNHDGKNFTTYDADNDWKPDGSCSKLYNGSWWFGDCWWSCLTCSYGTKCFSWWTLDTYGLQSGGKLRSARMMIRSNS